MWSVKSTWSTCDLINKLVEYVIVRACVNVDDDNDKEKKKLHDYQGRNFSQFNISLLYALWCV